MTRYITVFAQFPRYCPRSEARTCEIFPHTMRHSRLECLAQGTDTRLLDENGKPRKYPLEQVQVFAHHESCDMTKMYLKNHDDDIINSMFF